MKSSKSVYGICAPPARPTLLGLVLLASAISVPVWIIVTLASWMA